MKPLKWRLLEKVTKRIYLVKYLPFSYQKKDPLLMILHQIFLMEYLIFHQIFHQMFDLLSHQTIKLLQDSVKI